MDSGCVTCAWPVITATSAVGTAAPSDRVWDDLVIAVTQDREGGRRVGDDRVPKLLADAAEFFEAYLWGSETSGKARQALAEEGLDESVIRGFGLGYAPVGPDEMINALVGLDYSLEDLLAAGLATRSTRRRLHAHFRSRVIFPVRDREGGILGFAGLGTHLGPSWPLWITSPDVGLYRRSQAVFGLDRAASEIAATGKALVRPDCIEVLRAHQDGHTNAVTVHTNAVTREQRLELAGGVRGGIDALELDLPESIPAESERESETSEAAGAVQARPSGRSESAEVRPRYLTLKRLALVIATALAAVNAWTGAPLLAVWLGSQVQPGRLVTMLGVVTVVAALAVFEFLLAWALTWLNAKYDELTGRPRTATQTSPWHRAKRGDRVEDVRSRYGTSAPEKVVAACVVAGVLAFEIWFFFFAGSSLPS
jgi:DNA primase catalytic core, N-terminal domain